MWRVTCGDAGEGAGVAGGALALDTHPLASRMQVQAVAGPSTRPQILRCGLILIGGGIDRGRFRHAVGEIRVGDGGFRRWHGRQIVHLGFAGTATDHQCQPQGRTTKKFIHNNNIRFEF